VKTNSAIRHSISASAARNAEPVGRRSSGASLSALQCDQIVHFREDSATHGAGVVNAKSQGRKGAKSFFRLGDFAVLFTRIAQFWQNFPNRLSK